jgi:hypothetical protein
MKYLACAWGALQGSQNRRARTAVAITCFTFSGRRLILKRAVQEQAQRQHTHVHPADVVLIEDKASGTQLI